MVSIMASDVLTDLKWAEINLAKVKDITEMETGVRELLANFRTDIQIKEEVQTAIDTIEQRTDYELNLDIVNNIDNVINKHSNLVVKDGKPLINGTESFGLTMMPAEWRKTRSAALKQILGESYKNIKRWANQLSDNFHRRWVELITSTEVLETRLESLDSTLNIIGSINDGYDTVELNELISRSVSKMGKVIGGDQAKGIQGEVNYILSCLKSWEMEQVKFKNSVIRYFGNDKNTDITVISRELPRLFDIRAKTDTNEGMLQAKQTRPMLDGYTFEGISLESKWIKENIKTPEDGALYADSLSLTGYSVKSESGQRVGKVSVPIMSVSQMYLVRDVVETIINKLKTMNVESDAVNFNPDDVKDVLATLKNGSTDDSRAYQYGLITADYQFDVNNFKTQASSYLTILASHFITMLNQHLECYSVE